MAHFSELWVSGEKEQAPETLVDLLLHASEHHTQANSTNGSTNGSTNVSTINSTLEHKSFSWLDENGVIAQSLTYPHNLQVRNQRI